MAATLAELLEDRPPLVTARAHDRVAECMERMLEHDYSQLPVIEDDDRLIGMVTTTGVARASLHLGVTPKALRVHHAMDAHPRIAHLTDTLWRALDRARDGEAIAIVADDRRLVGLLTGHDFTTYLRNLSEDSLAVADIEETVKQLILRHYNGDDGALNRAVVEQLKGAQRSLMGDVRRVVGACLDVAGADPNALSGGVYKTAFDTHFIGNVTGEFDRLTFAQYNAIFLHRTCWSSFEAAFELEAPAMRGLLDEAREIRNRLAHHRGTLSATERDRVTYCRALLNRVADLVDDGEPEPAPLPDDGDIDAGEGGYDESSDDSDVAFAALGRHLDGLDESPIIHTFDDVNTLVGGTLPVVAYQHRSWWTNDEEAPQSRSWLDAGWRVVSANMTKQTVKFARNTNREEAAIRAFSLLFRRLTEADWPLDTPSPAGRAWQAIDRLPKRGRSTAVFFLSFPSGRRFHVELYIDSRDADTNKASFDALQQHADALEAAAGVSLVWERLDNRRACRVAAPYPEEIGIEDDEEALEALAAWVVQVAPPFHAAMKKHYKTVKPK